MVRLMCRLIKLLRLIVMVRRLGRIVFGLMFLFFTEWRLIVVTLECIILLCRRCRGFAWFALLSMVLVWRLSVFRWDLSLSMILRMWAAVCLVRRLICRWLVVWLLGILILCLVSIRNDSLFIVLFMIFLLVRLIGRRRLIVLVRFRLGLFVLVVVLFRRLVMLTGLSRLMICKVTLRVIRLLRLLFVVRRIVRVSLMRRFVRVVMSLRLRLRMLWMKLLCSGLCGIRRLS